MKVAIVFEQYERMHETKDPGILLSGLHQLDLDVIMVTLNKPSLGVGIPSILQTTRDNLCDPEFWTQQGFDYAIGYFWANPRYREIVHALKEAHIPLIIKLDSDGFISPSSFPGEYWRRAVESRSPTVLLKTLLRMMVGRWLDGRILDMYQAADQLVIESPVAATHLSTFFFRRGQPAMGEKVIVIPNPIVRHPMPEVVKERRVALVGRWDDRGPKNTGTAIAVIRRLLDAERRIGVVVFGTGIEDWRRSFPDEPRVELCGSVSHERLLHALTGVQVLFQPSRFESFSYAAGEALTRGATLVATPFPSAYYFTQHGRFGTVSAGFGRDSLTEALTAELACWDRGERDGKAIAAYWTEELAADRIAQRFASMMFAEDEKGTKKGAYVNAGER
jgi:glycosyltransferase involved in cell wall biosynthesis